MAAITAFGSVRDVDAGELLARAGDATYNLEVILSGSVEVVVIGNDEESVIVEFGPGQFVGELGLITGQRAFLTMRVSRPGRVLEIDRDGLRRLLDSEPDLADVVFAALSARRDLLLSSGAAGAVRIIGSRYSPEALALRAYATRSGIVHQWIDLDEVDDPEVVLAGLGLRTRDTPAVITSTVLRRATPGELAHHLGPDLLGASGLPGRPGRGGHRTGRARSRGVRGGRGAAHLSRSTGWRSAARRARARGSRTTSGSRAGSPEAS